MVAIERFMRTVDPESYCEFTEEEKKKSGAVASLLPLSGLSSMATTSSLRMPDPSDLSRNWSWPYAPGSAQKRMRLLRSSNLPGSTPGTALSCAILANG